MAWLELSVNYMDGTSRVERTERDDARGRRSMDEAAWVRLSWPAVESITVERIERRANARGKGTHR